MMPAFAMFAVTQLVHLSGVDVVIIAFYFALVLAIGFYLRGRSSTVSCFERARSVVRSSARPRFLV